VTATGTFEAIAVHDRLVKPVGAQPWIGLVRGEPDGQFVWENDEPTTPFEQPIDAAPGLGLSLCARVATGKLWVGAFLPMHFVPTACEATAPALCEQPPWALHRKDNHAYLVVSLPASWPAARDDCARRGGHLATVTSAEEQTFLAAQSFAAYWIGASDLEREGTFRWITGEPFDYRTFVAGEPDDHTGKDDCVMVGVEKGWHDRGCDERHAYACEID